MRRPTLGKTIDQAKEVALRYIQSDDWRLRYTAIYLLHGYMTPGEIMRFLKVTPAVVRNNLMVIKKIKRHPKLLKCNTLREVLAYKPFEFYASKLPRRIFV